MTSKSAEPPLFADLTLARRLERTEGRSNAHFVEARAKLFPDSGARWIEVAGAYAMYDGTTSPLTQTFGLGLFAPVSRADMETIEDFFRQHGAPVFHEVSPLADGAVLGFLNDRGYHPMEFTSVMFRPIQRDVQLTAAVNEKIQVRRARTDEHELWALTATKGWNASGELADFMLTIGQISAQAEGAVSFLAEWDGRPIATGGLVLADGVALLAGASTVPEARKQGAQLALLDSRLRYAAEQGCDIAMMGAAPGSGSQRNAERHGFRIAYTRIKWRLGPAPKT
jgi:GNAT superfamily N-acetyltransferase